MIEDLLTEEVQEFIRKHEADDPEKLLLKYHGKEWPLREIATQIKSRQKYRFKFPELISAGILFPGSRAAEQSSSEMTARFKAGLFQGTSIVDLTGGMGVDAIYLSNRFEELHYVEPNSELCEYAAYNLKNLDRPATVINTTAEEFLKSGNEKYDLIYADPDRRVSSSRVFRIQDCNPDLGLLANRIQRRAKNWMFKLSPMLDIAEAITSIPDVTRVYLIGVENELKEMVLCHGFSDMELQYFCVDINGGDTLIESFSSEEVLETKPILGDVSAYLYEPFATHMKLGAFGNLSMRYQVHQVGENSHLFSSDDLKTNLPGKIFKVKDIIKPDKKEIARGLKRGGASVVTRNYPKDAEQLRKQYKIPHGDQYLHFTRVQGNKHIAILSERIK